MRSLLLVMAGGALGAGLRHLVGLAALRVFGSGFPVGTLTVNVAGSFAMGLLVAWLARGNDAGAGYRAFLAVGLLGGFTTFSSFSLDAVALWERGQVALAGAYVAASLVLAVGGLVAGLAVGRALL